jgi:hypothetical protein
VTIALPIHHGRLSPLLDTASRLLVLTCRDGRETARREIVLAPQAAEALARSRWRNCISDLLLCGAASEPLLHRLAPTSAYPRLAAPLRRRRSAILHACCHGQLAREEFRIPGCHITASMSQASVVARAAAAVVRVCANKSAPSTKLSQPNPMKIIMLRTNTIRLALPVN